ncbi:MAG: hypothetical protein ACOCP8_08215 [archaeon]
MIVKKATGWNILLEDTGNIYFKEFNGKIVLIDDIEKRISVFKGNKVTFKNSNFDSDNFIYNKSLFKKFINPYSLLNPSYKLREKEIQKDLKEWFSNNQITEVMEEINFILEGGVINF